MAFDMGAGRLKCLLSQGLGEVPMWQVSQSSSLLVYCGVKGER